MIRTAIAQRDLTRWLPLSIGLTVMGFVRLNAELPTISAADPLPAIAVGVTWGLGAFLALWAALRAVAMPRPVLRLVLAAAALRMAWAVYIYWWSYSVGMNGAVANDDALYFALANNMANQVRTGQELFIPRFGGYYLYNMGVNLLTDGNPVAPLVFNAVLGALAVAHVYRIATRLFDARVGILAATLTAVSPELCFWSAVNVKDSHVIVAILGLTDWLGTLEERGHTSVGWLVYAFALGLALTLMRPVFTFMFVALAACRLLSVWSRRITWAKVASTVAALILFAGLLFRLGYYPGGEGLADLAKYDVARQEVAASYSSGSLTAIANPVALRSQPYLIPIALAFALITPFPFFRLHVLPGTAEFALMYAGVLFWYVMLLPAALGLFAVAWLYRWRALAILWWVFLIWASIATETGGATFRYRASMAPFMLILAAFAFRRMAAWRWLYVPYGVGMGLLCAAYLILK